MPRILSFSCAQLQSLHRSSSQRHLFVLRKSTSEILSEFSALSSSLVSHKFLVPKRGLNLTLDAMFIVLFLHTLKPHLFTHSLPSLPTFHFRVERTSIALNADDVSQQVSQPKPKDTQGKVLGKK